MTAVCVKTYPAPATDMREMLRYAGVREELPDMEALAVSCLDELRAGLSYRLCYAEFEIALQEDGALDLGFARVRSASLARHLAGCDSVVVFAATVGLEVDRLVARHAPKTPSRALMLNAVGVERVEALCDAFCSELATAAAARGCTCRPRFSPGYGDLPLALQRDIVRVLDTPRRIGVSLNESLLMTPTKSVTAIVGLAKIQAENKETV